MSTAIGGQRVCLEPVDVWDEHTHFASSMLHWVPCTHSPLQRFVCQGDDDGMFMPPLDMVKQYEVKHRAFLCRWKLNPGLCLDVWNDNNKVLLYKCVLTINQWLYADNQGRWHSKKDDRCLSTSDYITTCDVNYMDSQNNYVAAPSQHMELADLTWPPFPPGLAPMPTPPSPPPTPPTPETPMNSEQCKRYLRDETHIFRRMWAAEAWGKMNPGGGGGNRPACWNVNRIVNHGKQQWQATDRYFQETMAGTWCDANWYENGRNDDIGNPDIHIPYAFDRGKVAPALLGFDETIDQYCAMELHKAGKKFDERSFMHAINCQNANINILALYGDRLPYNICRNLEWMTCAAQGRLPGQKGTPQLIFAKSPGQLFPEGSSGKPLNTCCGWAPDKRPNGGVYAYTTDDIFYLEVCLFNEICENGPDLFNTPVGQPFHCQFSANKFRELERILSSGFVEPEDATQCRTHKKCTENLVSHITGGGAFRP